MGQLIEKINDIFAQGGLLCQNLPGYSVRAAQLKMAHAIGNALEENQVLVAEAGTGTGKTYAYLIPAILSRKKVLISTGTKNLQDQLFHRDLPIIRRVLSVPLKIALLKGRSNYVCLHRLHTFLKVTFISSEATRSLSRVLRKVEQTNEGEVEYLNLTVESKYSSYFTSTRDNCLGQECEFFAKCYLYKARKVAQEADIIIINHHLFFADSLLKSTGHAELLPEVGGIVFDEAHQLPEIATHFLSQTLSARQIIYLARDVQAQQQVDAADLPHLKTLSERLIEGAKTASQTFGIQPRGSWEQIANKPDLKCAISNLLQLLQEMQCSLEAVAIRSKGLESCWRRALELTVQFNKLTSTLSDEHVHWYELHENHFAIHQTPIEIGDYFQSWIQTQQKTWIFTSATLSVKNNFDHFESYLGLREPTRLHVESPFDYSKQAVLYIPTLNKLPHEEDYIPALLEMAIPVINLTRGRAFFLFTSHRALRQAALLLKPRVTFPLLIQGEASKSQLLATFDSLSNAILLGTSSFWEGVDVKDNKLYCVIIDKIPFMVPDDPIHKAKIAHYKRLGRNPFLEFQLPHAIIALRQGIGRLIRDVNDKGILMLCDPRLLSKQYGETVLQSLPAMPITHSFSELTHFMEKKHEPISA